MTKKEQRCSDLADAIYYQLLRRKLTGLDAPHEGDTGVSEGFLGSCDSYSAYCMTVKQGTRTYYITVEDVTVKRED